MNCWYRKLLLLLLNVLFFLRVLLLFFIQTPTVTAFLFPSIISLPGRKPFRCCRNNGQNHPRVTTIHSSTPLIDYDARIDKRLVDADSQSVATAAAVESSSSTINDEMKFFGELPMIDFLEIIQLSLAASQSNEDASKRQSLAQGIASHGGYCIVRLPFTTSSDNDDDDDDWERHVITTLWKSMYQLFENNTNNNNIEKQQPFRHQTLTRSNDEESHRKSGYQFIQTSLQDSAAVSPAFQDAFILLSLLAKAFTVICYSAIVNPWNPAEATRRIDAILDENDNNNNNNSRHDTEKKNSKMLRRRPLAGTYHRLCRYVENTEECLRSHADWTCATSIPISKVPGLEIYDAQIQAWVQPEKLLTSSNGPSSCKNVDDIDDEEHTKYIVVMSGKWLELLTGGAVPSCLHRVVGNAQGQTRFSAPLFLRPKESLFALLENLRYKDKNDDNDRMVKTSVSTKQRNDCVQFIANSLKDLSSVGSMSLSTRQ